MKGTGPRFCARGNSQAGTAGAGHNGDIEAVDETPDEMISSRANPASSQLIKIQRIMDNDEVVELQSIGYNGADCWSNGGRCAGFVPASQLIDSPPRRMISPVSAC